MIGPQRERQLYIEGDFMITLSLSLTEVKLTLLKLSTTWRSLDDLVLFILNNRLTRSIPHNFSQIKLFFLPRKSPSWIWIFLFQVFSSKISDKLNFLHCYFTVFWWRYISIFWRSLVVKILFRLLKSYVWEDTLAKQIRWEMYTT